MRLAIHCPFVPARLDEAARLGLHHLQLRLGPGFPIATDDDRLADARRAADDLAARGLTVVALGCYRNPLAADLGERRVEIERLRRVMRMARIFGTDLIGVFAGRDPDRGLEDNLPAFTAVWTPLAQAAERAGLRFAFENCTMLRGDPPHGINMATTPHILERMFEAVPSPALGLELDPSHLAKQWLDPASIVRRFEGRVFHVHAKDHETLAEQLAEHGRFDLRTSRDRLPGRGQIDFANLFTALAETGYDGPISLEPEHGVDLPDDLPAEERLARLSEAVRFLRGARDGARPGYSKRNE